MRMEPHRSGGGRTPWRPAVRRCRAATLRATHKRGSRDRPLEPRLTATKLTAYVVAIAVSGGTLALAVGGVALAVSVFPNIVSLLLAALMVMAAFLVRPRFGTVPENDVVARSQAPTLYALVDDVAAALRMPSVHVVAVDAAYNASWAVLGLRRRRVLTLGLPLLAAVEPWEQVALIAHELAHGRNGDARRGLVVGSVVRGLAELYELIGPEPHPGLGLFEWFGNALFWIASRPVLWLLLLEQHLLLQDGRRAEYGRSSPTARRP